jgi:hypothetical protein
MALGFFDQENIARAKTPPGSVPDLYFKLPLEQDDELSVWGIVPSIMGITIRFPKDDPDRGDSLREAADVASVF